MEGLSCPWGTGPEIIPKRGACVPNVARPGFAIHFTEVSEGTEKCSGSLKYKK